MVKFVILAIIASALLLLGCAGRFPPNPQNSSNNTTTADTTPPEVSQMHVLIGNRISISATARDPSGISEITIRLSYPPESAIAIADRVIKTCSSSPCSTDTFQLTSGRYYYFASAKDTHGNLKAMEKTYFNVPVGTDISGRALQTNSYCGGAAPPQELLVELATPKPLPNKTLYIKNGASNSNSPPLSFTTDSGGRFALALPAGAYCIVEDYKKGAPDPEAYRRTIGAGGNCTAVDLSCFATLWQQCDAVLKVGSESASNFTVQYDRKCPWSSDCISWSCPLPA